MNTNSAVQFETESRIHMGLAVKNLENSIAFYTSLLGQPPTKTRPRYAKFEVAEPPVNLSLNEVRGATGQNNPVAHFGIQLKSSDAVKRRRWVAPFAPDGFDFLGYHFCGTRHGVREKSLKKIKETLREQKKRTSGKSLQFIIADVNRTLRGWFAYVQHSRPFVFEKIDCFTRQRLRAILKKRSKRRGCAKGGAHRWKTTADR
jgi:catechol 2,3-dioxygenase-like lactoylglutathione lyase family enzyme